MWRNPKALEEVVREAAPAVVFLDEVDSLLGSRDAGGVAEHHRSTTNALLAWMDGFGTGEERIFFLGATNRAEAIDEAALRRFGEAVEVGSPSLEARIALVRHLLSKAKLDGHRADFCDEDLQVVGEKMNGFSLADVDRMVRKAFLQIQHRLITPSRRGHLAWQRDLNHLKEARGLGVWVSFEEQRDSPHREFSATFTCCGATGAEEGPKEAEAREPRQAMSDAAPVPEGIRRLQLKSVDDEDMTLVSHRALEESRRKVMVSSFPQLSEGSAVAIVARSPNGEQREFVATTKGDGYDLVFGSCQITFEDLTPADCIEYCFPEAPSEWHMAQVSREALETYRGMKFEAWKQMLQKPTCEAQFRRGNGSLC
eukprot:s2963_g1.t1